MPQPLWYDPETDPSKFMAALWEVRHLCTRAEHVRMTVPGSYVLVQAIMSAIDDYAERETGNRRPHKAADGRVRAAQGYQAAQASWGWRG
jgi:hypothetical protein